MAYQLVINDGDQETTRDFHTKREALRAWERAVKEDVFSAKLWEFFPLYSDPSRKGGRVIADHESC